MYIHTHTHTSTYTHTHIPVPMEVSWRMERLRMALRSSKSISFSHMLSMRVCSRAWILASIPCAAQHLAACQRLFLGIFFF